MADISGFGVEFWGEEPHELAVKCNEHQKSQCISVQLHNYHHLPEICPRWDQAGLATNR